MNAFDEHEYRDIGRMQRRVQPREETAVRRAHQHVRRFQVERGQQRPQLLDFLMHFGHVLPEPPNSRPLTCALTIAGGYFIGGLIPLLPYIIVDRQRSS